MLNKVILIGRFVRDPELRYTPQGIPVCRFTLAVDRPANSEAERQADFIDCLVWREQAENVRKYLGKGRLVAVEGRLQIRSYDDSQGVRRKAAEVICQRVIFMPDGKGKGIEPPPWPEEEPQYGKKQASEHAPEDDLTGDEIPFNEDDLPF
ncbi:single-stranded DNA-binding protein [Desulfofundulus sp.]|uniref:single-stranded DNA-binding protein n=1 Tax=Desulfofundulus sp. TaxID=2282750 RepID=UPI003C74B136